MRRISYLSVTSLLIDRITSSHIKFKFSMKLAPKLLAWVAIYPKGISRVYIDRTNTAIDTETYIKECIRKRLIFFIDRYHTGDSILFWAYLASTHYARKVHDVLTGHPISVVLQGGNAGPTIRKTR
jgi:hypothetical protein